MVELRKDYILDRWVILAPLRKKRPRDYVRQSFAVKQDECVFCAGNERLTPSEIGRINSPGGGWSMRWFRNLFPAVMEEGQKEVRTDNAFYTFASAYGVHEIIVETPKHDRQLWDFSSGDMMQLLQVYRERMAELYNADAVKYVAVFKNHGLEAGTSIVHSHSQVVTTNLVPPLLAEEAAAIMKHQQANNNQCPYCSILRTETESYRRCFENNYAVAFTPYASRFNFEIWVFPKRHFRQLSDATPDELSGFSEVVASVLSKLRELNASYNYVLHCLPAADFHFHIEVQPRISTWAGFESNTNIIINSVTPEDAAKFYRGEE